MLYPQSQTQECQCEWPLMSSTIIFKETLRKKKYPLWPPCPPFGSKRNVPKGKSMSSYIYVEENHNIEDQCEKV